MRKIDRLALTLIRHAHSKFNKAHAEKGFKKVKFDPELIDPEITDLGIKQAQRAGDQLKNKPYDAVFVSPLRRTIQTATHIFKENPGKPKLIAIPSLTEMLVSVGEIGKDYFNTKKTFNHVDFSIMDKLKRPELWYLDCIENVDWKKSVLEEARQQGITEPDKIAYFVLEKLKASPVFPETLGNLTRRMQEAKTTIKDYVAENGSDKKYAIVSHYCVLEELTRTKENPGIAFDNCQIVEYIFE